MTPKLRDHGFRIGCDQGLFFSKQASPRQNNSVVYSTTPYSLLFLSLLSSSPSPLEFLSSCYGIQTGSPSRGQASRHTTLLTSPIMSKHIFFLLFFLSGIQVITLSQLNSTTESISNKDLDKNYSIISSRYYSYIHLFNKHLLNVFYFLDDTDVMITKTIFSALPDRTVKQRMQANKQVVLIWNDKFNFGKFRCYNNISKKKLHRIKDQQIILE